MTQTEFENKLAQIKEQEAKYNVTINISDIIDKDHLNCVWYGGEVGTIKTSDGYTITIGAYGDIYLYGVIDGEEIYVKDKSNGGYVYNEIGYKVNDNQLHKLLTSYSEQNYLIYGDNNWFEVNVISPKGDFIDLGCTDNVLYDDLLDCFLGIETYFEYINDIKSATE